MKVKKEISAVTVAEPAMLRIAIIVRIEIHQILIQETPILETAQEVPKADGRIHTMTTKCPEETAV